MKYNIKKPILATLKYILQYKFSCVNYQQKLHEIWDYYFSYFTLYLAMPVSLCLYSCGNRVRKKTPHLCDKKKVTSEGCYKCPLGVLCFPSFCFLSHLLSLRCDVTWQRARQSPGAEFSPHKNSSFQLEAKALWGVMGLLSWVQHDSSDSLPSSSVTHFFFQSQFLLIQPIQSWVRNKSDKLFSDRLINQTATVRLPA